jgi:hypothetical protein
LFKDYLDKYPVRILYFVGEDYTFSNGKKMNRGQADISYNSIDDAKQDLEGISKLNTAKQIEEGAVIDTALGVAGGLVGLWALINGGAVVLGALGGTALSIADKMKDKAQKAAAKAKKEGRLDTIKPIIAKFENDEELKNMYQALPAKNNSGDNRERNKQMTAIAKYIKSKLNDEEMKYFTDISAMLRTGDIA